MNNTRVLHTHVQHMHSACTPHGHTGARHTRAKKQRNKSSKQKTPMRSADEREGTNGVRACAVCINVNAHTEKQNEYMGTTNTNEVGIVIKSLFAGSQLDSLFHSHRLETLCVAVSLYARRCSIEYNISEKKRRLSRSAIVLAAT